MFPLSSVLQPFARHLSCLHHKMKSFAHDNHVIVTCVYLLVMIMRLVAMAMLLGKLIPKICYGALFGTGTFRRMTVSDVASEMLVSERTVQQYVERFQQTASVRSPFVKRTVLTGC